MYVAVYDSSVNHIANIDNAIHQLTTRVYDPNSFTAEGTCPDDINNACLAVLNTETGHSRYACLVDNITPENDLRTVKGLDFKTLWDSEILLDYTAAGSFDGRFKPLMQKVSSQLFNSPDATFTKITVQVVIPDDFTDTTPVFGSKQGTYSIVNAYSNIKGYLKYYEYNIESEFDLATKTIIFTFVKHDTQIAVSLKDFDYELQTTTNATNKAVATIKYAPTVENDENGDPLPIPPRPTDIATVYYYRDSENNIVQSDAAGDIANRIYPVKAKIFESEYLADAQYDAVSELANARYVDNIIIDNNAVLDPIDLAAYPLYTKVDVYYDGKLYKTLPISEKITTADENGENTKVKLGFKKILLTEIIKTAAAK
jgi:hypothetical protein